MQLEQLYDKARKNDWPYFFMAYKNSFLKSSVEKDNTIEYIFKELYFSYCVATYATRKLIVAVNNELSNIEERNGHLNRTIAHSLSKSYRIPIISGIGNKSPVIYKIKKEFPLINSNFSYILYLLTGKNDTKNINIKTCHTAIKDKDFHKSRLDFIHKVKIFGIDVVPAFILSNYKNSEKKAPWIEALKIELVNPEAKKYLNHI